MDMLSQNFASLSCRDDGFDDENPVIERSQINEMLLELGVRPSLRENVIRNMEENSLETLGYDDFQQLCQAFALMEEEGMLPAEEAFPEADEDTFDDSPVHDKRPRLSTPRRATSVFKRYSAIMGLPSEENLLLSADAELNELLADSTEGSTADRPFDNSSTKIEKRDQLLREMRNEVNQLRRKIAEGEQIKKENILKKAMLDKELHVVMHAKESLESANAKIDVEETSKTVRSKLQHLVKLRAKLTSTRQCRRAKQEAFIKTKRKTFGDNAKHSQSMKTIPRNGSGSPRVNFSQSQSLEERPRPSKIKMPRRSMRTSHNSLRRSDRDSDNQSGLLRTTSFRQQRPSNAPYSNASPGGSLLRTKSFRQPRQSLSPRVDALMSQQRNSNAGGGGLLRTTSFRQPRQSFAQRQSVEQRNSNASGGSFRHSRQSVEELVHERLSYAVDTQVSFAEAIKLLIAEQEKKKEMINATVKQLEQEKIDNDAEAKGHNEELGKATREREALQSKLQVLEKRTENVPEATPSRFERQQRRRLQSIHLIATTTNPEDESLDVDLSIVQEESESDVDKSAEDNPLIQEHKRPSRLTASSLPTLLSPPSLTPTPTSPAPILTPTSSIPATTPAASPATTPRETPPPTPTPAKSSAPTPTPPTPPPPTVSPPSSPPSSSPSSAAASSPASSPASAKSSKKESPARRGSKGTGVVVKELFPDAAEGKVKEDGAVENFFDENDFDSLKKELRLLALSLLSQSMETLESCLDASKLLLAHLKIKQRKEVADLLKRVLSSLNPKLANRDFHLASEDFNTDIGKLRKHVRRQMKQLLIQNLEKKGQRTIGEELDWTQLSHSKSPLARLADGEFFSCTKCHSMNAMVRIRCAVCFHTRYKATPPEQLLNTLKKLLPIHSGSLLVQSTTKMQSGEKQMRLCQVKHLKFKIAGPKGEEKSSEVQVVPMPCVKQMKIKGRVIELTLTNAPLSTTLANRERRKRMLPDVITLEASSSKEARKWHRAIDKHVQRCLSAQKICEFEAQRDNNRQEWINYIIHEYGIILLDIFEAKDGEALVKAEATRRILATERKNRTVRSGDKELAAAMLLKHFIKNTVTRAEKRFNQAYESYAPLLKTSKLIKSFVKK